MREPPNREGSLLSRLFKRNNVSSKDLKAPAPSEAITRAHEGSTSLRRSVSVPNPESSDNDEDGELVRPDETGMIGRRMTVDKAPIRSTERVPHARAAKRSISAKTIGEMQGLLAARFSITNTGACSDNGMQNALWAYSQLDTKHRGRNCMVMIGSSRNKDAQQVIIKTFDKSRMTETQRERRNREMEILESVCTVPNVMRLIAPAEDEDNYYTILRACPGCSLIELMARSGGGRISEEQCAISVARPVFEALAGLHARSIVHRHLKPEHIICGTLTPEGAISSVLIDFLDAINIKQQCPNSRVGEIQYMAPEVLTKPNAEDIFHKVLFNGMAEEELPQYDEKVDIWSIGVVLIEAMTGRQPFMADSIKEMGQVQKAMLSDLMPDGSTPSFLARHGLSPLAVDLLAKIFKDDPDLRPRAEELLRHPWIQSFHEEP